MGRVNAKSSGVDLLLSKTMPLLQGSLGPKISHHSLADTNLLLKPSQEYCLSSPSLEHLLSLSFGADLNDLVE